MKRKGFDIESLRNRDTQPRNRLVLACFIAATVVMQMTAERDGSLLRPQTGAFEPEDQTLLEATSRDVEGATARQNNSHRPGSLAFATWVCARPGGWTGYYGKSGLIVIWCGWTEFQTLRHGAVLAQALIRRGNQDV